jgi:hypothetical protein
MKTTAGRRAPRSLECCRNSERWALEAQWVDYWYGTPGTAGTGISGGSGLIAISLIS